jgi:hypothetical protein
MNPLSLKGKGSQSSRFIVLFIEGGLSPRLLRLKSQTGRRLRLISLYFQELKRGDYLPGNRNLLSLDGIKRRRPRTRNLGLKKLQNPCRRDLSSR